MKELFAYYSLKIIGKIIRHLPLEVAIWIGRFSGLCGYYFNRKHKRRAYTNLKLAFAHAKSPKEIKQMTKKLFINYGLNFVDLFRMPKITQKTFRNFVSVEGDEHIKKALEQGNGVIFLAMHFGSWEIASLSCTMLGLPYKMFVKTQHKFSRLDDLLNSYRERSGYAILKRGLGTRDFLKSLKNNEVVGMVTDQGGRDGVLVSFMGRSASMSVGAIRMGLKWNVPLCFSVIYREGDKKHKLIINKPFELEKTGNVERDVIANLNRIVKIMERYVCEHPAEYMWFYKIWKYSDERRVIVLDDGKTGHLRQSQTVAGLLQDMLGRRNIKIDFKEIKVAFQSKFKHKIFSFLAALSFPFQKQGHLDSLKWFLTEESYKNIITQRGDFIISCGSSVAGLNYFLAQDDDAKSIVILKPSLMDLKRFDLVILPQHDMTQAHKKLHNIVFTKAAPNLIHSAYLEEQKDLLLRRYSHLKSRMRLNIGLFIGGDAQKAHISALQIKILIRQLKEVSKEINADILVTTSRRTPHQIEQILLRELKKDDCAPLVIIANRESIPEAVGGILALSDIVIVSGDSISMISEAACSGKKTIVFSPQSKTPFLKGQHKHNQFIESLNLQGHILSTDVAHIGRAVFDMAKNKIQTTPIDDNEVIKNAIKRII